MEEEEIRILCVDDEPNVLNSLKRLFLDEDYTIISAPSAQEGLKVLEKEYVQIIISDYRMPNMNGVEFLREVRTRWPDTVRIVLSGYADAAAVVSAINEGQIYKFIPKPWNDDELKVTVSNAIERYFLFKKNAQLTSELMKVNEELTNLLFKKSQTLELKGKMLETSQTILYSLPVAVLGISTDDVIVQCNEAWAEETNDHWQSLGKSIENAFPADAVQLVNEVKTDGKLKKEIVLNGVPGCLFGSAIRGSEDESKGVILVFIPREGDKCRR